MATAEWRSGLATGFMNEDEYMVRATESVLGRAYHMKKAMEDGNMTTTLKNAVEMLKELSAPLIPPKNYSKLYQEVFHNLGELPFFFEDQVASGQYTHMGLYETIQHAGFVLPRLYLMCVAGCACMKSDALSAPMMLSDLRDMCKGVQHPIHGLFLRSFLVSAVKPYLPDSADTGSGDEGNGREDSSAKSDQAGASGAGTSAPAGQGGAPGPSEGQEQQQEDLPVMVSINFLLSNFEEMNKLWTRMARQGGPASSDDRNERQRQDLSDLVGKNLMLLSQLNGLDFEIYESHVLPSILEQIESCDDKVAQQYLMECLMMTFPDEYHLQTLKPVLVVCAKLHSGVKIHSILSTLMERLANYTDRSETPVESLQSADTFDHFLEAAKECGMQQTSMPARDVIQMFIALSRFVENVYGNNVHMYNAILEGCHDALHSRGTVDDRKGQTLLVDMLLRPLQGFDMTRVLALDKFPLLVTMLPPDKRRTVAAAVVDAVQSSGAPVTEVAHVRMLVAFVRPLVFDDNDSTLDDEDREDNMTLVAKLVHLLRSPDLTTLTEMVRCVRQFVLHGASSSSLYVVPIEALGNKLILALAERARAGVPVADVTPTLDYFHAQLASTVQGPRPASALRLYLQMATLLASLFKDAPSTHRFLGYAVQVYDLHCAFQPVSVSGLAALTNTLASVSVLPEAEYLQLAESVGRYASSLPAWSTKVLATLNTSHLYWQPDRSQPFQDSGKVEKVIQRALTLVQSAADVHCGGPTGSPAPMYLDVLDALICLKHRGFDSTRLLTSLQSDMVPARDTLWSDALETRRKAAMADLAAIQSS